MKGYAQFCPVAKAAEILDRRWTLLILRELHCGSHRFNEIHRGVPRMSRSLLARRMRELEAQGLIKHHQENGEHAAYRLTSAGEELGPVIMQLGAWGKRWIRSYLSRDDLDAGLLMWDVQRHVSPDSLPEKRIVTNFNFRTRRKTNGTSGCCLSLSTLTCVSSTPAMRRTCSLLPSLVLLSSYGWEM